MKKHKNIIWEGRFQPIHKGHLSYMRKLLELGERVWIVVLANETSTEVYSDSSLLPVKEFSKEVDFHHQPSKNTLPFWIRYLMVTEAVKEEFGATAPIIIMSGRRLDLAWDLYKKIFPVDRVFVTPLRDDFEDLKAKAWKQLGERNERIDVSDLPQISATMVRDRIAENKNVDDLLATSTIEILRNNNFLNN